MDTCGQVNEWMGRQMDTWENEQMDRWVNDGMDGERGGRTDE